MFKWTFLERENIVESKTGLHLSLRGLDVQIMAIKVPVKQMERAIRFPCFSLANNKSEIHGKIYFCLRQISRCKCLMKYVDHQSLIAIIWTSRPRRDKWRPVLNSTIFSLSRNVHLNIIWPTLKNAFFLLNLYSLLVIIFLIKRKMWFPWVKIMTERIMKEKKLLFTMIPILLKTIKNKHFCGRGELLI